jgi:hypothetical protein
MCIKQAVAPLCWAVVCTMQRHKLELQYNRTQSFNIKIYKIKNEHKRNILKIYSVFVVHAHIIQHPALTTVPPCRRGAKPNTTSISGTTMPRASGTSKLVRREFGKPPKWNFVALHRSAMIWMKSLRWHNQNGNRSKEGKGREDENRTQLVVTWR